MKFEKFIFFRQIQYILPLDEGNWTEFGWQRKTRTSVCLHKKLCEIKIDQFTRKAKKVDIGLCFVPMAFSVITNDKNDKTAYVVWKYCLIVVDK